MARRVVVCWLLAVSQPFRFSSVAACAQAVKDLMKQNEALDGLACSCTMQVQGSDAPSKSSIGGGVRKKRVWLAGGSFSRFSDVFRESA